MYNIYSDKKRISEIEKMHKNEKDLIISNQKHKLKTNRLSLNYQKRIKKFIIDVSILHIIYNILTYIFLIITDG
jgi:hypothetical protein